MCEFNNKELDEEIEESQFRLSQAEKKGLLLGLILVILDKAVDIVLWLIKR